MMNSPIFMDKLVVYNLVCQWRSFHERAQEGTMSTVLEAGDGWLIKSDLKGEELVEREFQVLLALQGTGLVPDVDEEEGVFGYPSSFLIKRVNNGATLGEYLRYFLSGASMNKAILWEVFEATAEKINAFHKLGFVHADLHDRNVVVGMDKGCTQFIPAIIDFGFSFHEDEGPHELDRTSIETAEEDNEYLVKTLLLIVDECEDPSLSETAINLITQFEGLLH